MFQRTKSVPLLFTLVLVAADLGSLAAASETRLELDLDTSGNSPRSVREIDSCRSIAVGESIEIDLVLPAPGVPKEAGLSAYQFTLFYDPELLWVTGDSANMMMAQAPGSQIVPLSDPKPDRNGVYVSWAVDFGPTAVEPAGASEKGPGVLARLTVTAQASGSAELHVSDLQLIDSASNPLALAQVKPAEVRIGRPCPGQADEETPSPTAEPSGPGPATAIPPADDDNSAAPAARAEGLLPRSGGPPGQREGQDTVLLLGLASLLLGSSLAAVALYAKEWHSE